MPTKSTIRRARKKKRQGQSPSSQAGEFVREEIHHVRSGKHGARSAKQAIAIGLSKARRAGVSLPPTPGDDKKTSRKRARRSERSGASTAKSPRRARAAREALEDEPRRSASHEALSRHAHQAARQRSAAERSASAKKAARTKGAAGRSEAAKKAARTREAAEHGAAASD